MQTITMLLLAVIVSGFLTRLLPFKPPLPMVQIATGAALSYATDFDVPLDPDVFFLSYPLRIRSRYRPSPQADSIPSAAYPGRRVAAERCFRPCLLLQETFSQAPCLVISASHKKHVLIYLNH
jgi:hypothetical protein